MPWKVFDSFDQACRPDGHQSFQIFSGIDKFFEVVNTKQSEL
ncbi:hypothetical protein [Paenibacillus pectinilyticus]|nr:hypothetical protein [Paenibacillus pectinilyticus]